MKGLILNKPKNKFLICKEESGIWELPGGGLEWGMTPQEDLKREIKEEMSLPTTKIAEHPSYFFTNQTVNRGVWIVNVLYETELESLDFTPSNECVDITFVNKDDIRDMNVFPTITHLANVFDPKNHIK